MRGQDQKSQASSNHSNHNQQDQNLSEISLKQFVFDAKKRLLWLCEGGRRGRKDFHFTDYASPYLHRCCRRTTTDDAI